MYDKVRGDAPSEGIRDWYEAGWTNVNEGEKRERRKVREKV